MNVARLARTKAAVGFCIAIGLFLNHVASAQPRGGFNTAPDPRVEQRTYRFTETGEDLPFALFVSSKVSKTEKAPLIVALHGLGGDGNSLLRGTALDLAEEGGYILVGPLGYNSSGWFGSPVIVMGRRGGGPGGDAPAGPDPERLAILSEMDVMNVIDIVRKEFTVDESRTYLMGHSMGGAGALFLGQKHADTWAAVAAIAPAAFMMQRNAADILKPMKDAGVPVLIIQGDADTVVPPDSARAWAAALTSLEMKGEYVELAGGDHGSVIGDGMPKIFELFGASSR